MLFHKIPLQGDPLVPGDLTLDRFEHLLDYVTAHSNVLPLSEAVAALQRGALPSRAVALTFDDGPDPGFTPPILDLLKAHGATASFFLIGDRIDQHPAVVERIVAEGHTLGNHSWDIPS